MADVSFTQRTDWVDFPDTTTPLLAADVLRIEQGIADLVAAVNQSWRRWEGTQAEFDAIVTKSDDTLYVITDA